jgi:hypothetical protein
LVSAVWCELVHISRESLVSGKWQELYSPGWQTWVGVVIVIKERKADIRGHNARVKKKW